MSHGDIAISVYFRADFVPWYQERLLRFVTMPGQDGNLHWYPLPMPQDFKMPGTMEKHRTVLQRKSFVDL
jgi:hypothetical protein